MTKLEKRHEDELNRMYDRLEALQPGTDEYAAVLSEIMKARNGENEAKRLKHDRDSAKVDQYVKIGLFVGGLILTPVIDTLCKRNLTKYIGTIEQMETFTSSPGRSISSWFRWK